MCCRERLPTDPKRNRLQVRRSEAGDYVFLSGVLPEITHSSGDQPSQLPIAHALSRADPPCCPDPRSPTHPPPTKTILMSILQAPPPSLSPRRSHFSWPVVWSVVLIVGLSVGLAALISEIGTTKSAIAPTPSTTAKRIDWVNATVQDNTLRTLELGLREDHIVVWRVQAVPTPTPAPLPPEATSQP